MCTVFDVTILMTEINHALEQPSSDLKKLKIYQNPFVQVKKKTVIPYGTQLLLIAQTSSNTYVGSTRGKTHTIMCYLFNGHYNNSMC